MVSYYFPEVMKEIAQGVNKTFNERKEDPFEVFFEHGLYEHVVQTVYKRREDGYETYPLIWLVMPFDERYGLGVGLQSEITCELLIVTKTQQHYKMIEREEVNYRPRLFPIYEELIKRIAASPIFNFYNPHSVVHTRKIVPYWAGTSEGSGVENFSKDRVDAIRIQGLRLTLTEAKQKC